MSLFPIILIGGAAYYFGKRKQKKKDKKKIKAAEKKALPSPEERGTVFPAGEVDVIEARVGERFTVAILQQAGLAYSWSLEATPPDNSIELVKQEMAEGSESLEETGIGGAAGNHLFIFQAKKPGAGALVFHYTRGFEKGQVPPEKVLEIQTKIS